ncbi:alpha-amylase family glycosyl hydrolase [Alteromonas facilis]|uniref:alpha-amylase family glycosyl hydrolase n=1 Tax=Alteromonas facilis TaxID=2048004 RepID=UPI000C28E831|nr:alpha-amylase family glycosyl hydrolase [Alteromonas facilis]
MRSSVLTVTPYSHVIHPEWSYDACIYQINTRQFSASGDFAGIILELPRLKRLGVDIIWLMPIHPIGEKHRKGHLGSPYAVKDYRSINPEFGDEESFAELISGIHANGMKVIIDWVPNHSAWDNSLVESHPDWYARDHKGDFRPSPWWDWSDIIEFDYANVQLREYMLDAMCYWVEQYDIDGFRCDVAGYVPNDFWRQVRAALDAIKPVFMLAEWEARDLHEYAFDMTYAWSWNEILHGLAQQKVSLNKLRQYYSWNERAWPREAFRMTFVSNHDKNAWDGTQYEQFGEALDAAIVLSVIGEGMPLIHNGQEAGESKRLAFFERDPIEWQEHYIGGLYQQLIALKKQHAVLHNGQRGSLMLQVENSNMAQVFSFVRRNDTNAILLVINFAPDAHEVTLHGELIEGIWQEVQLHTAQGYNNDVLNGVVTGVALDAWQARLFIQPLQAR